MKVKVEGQGQERTVASPCRRGGLAASERIETTTPRQMIDTGIPWIGQVPEGWEVWRFVHAFEFAKGLNITKADLAQSGVPVVSYGQIHSKENVGTILLQSLLRYVSREIADSDIGASLSKGDIVFADTSEDYDGVGNCVRINDDTEVFAGYHTIVAKPRFREASHYLAYLFQTVPWRSQLARNVNGIKVFSITQKVFRDATILLPPLPTQRAIAAYLDGECGKIDALCTKIEAQIADLATYKKSVITEAVTGHSEKGIVNSEQRPMKPSGVEWIGDVPAGWKVSRLKYTGIARNGLTYTPSDLCEADEGCLVLRSSNVQGGKMSFDDNVYVRSSIPAELMMQEDDILICSRNGSRELIGKNAIFREKVKASFGAFMMVFRAISAYPKFAYWAFNSTMFASYLGAYSTSTINQLVRGDFNNMELPLPPLPEQREIAAYLDEKCAAIDAAVAKCREQLTDLASYKKSLIYECVTGKKEVA